jgi:hypothetical protein
LRHDEASTRGNAAQAQSKGQGPSAVGRRGRTPAPSPIGRAEESDGQLLRVVGSLTGGDKARTGALAARRRRRTVPAEPPVADPEKSRPSSRQRTPAPEAAPQEHFGLQGAMSAQLAEKLAQLRYLQDFFHNPVPFDLRDKPLPTSSEPEELTKRIGEVEYQMHVLKALMQVLGEELRQLNRAALPPRRRQRREQTS